MSFKQGETEMQCQMCADNHPREHDAAVGKWIHPINAASFIECGFQEAVGRKGDWIQTFTGRQFFPLDPRPEDFHILDIAAGLRNARYSSQSLIVETVAEHSVALWLYARAHGFDARERRTILMHDASEAYLVDVPRPIKRDLGNYLDIEEGIMHAAAERFDLVWPMPPELKNLDNAILADECSQNMADPPAPWRQLVAPLGIELPGWSPERAMIMFLNAAAVEAVF